MPFCPAISGCQFSISRGISNATLGPMFCAFKEDAGMREPARRIPATISLMGQLHGGQVKIASPAMQWATLALRHSCSGLSAGSAAFRSDDMRLFGQIQHSFVAHEPCFAAAGFLHGIQLVGGDRLDQLKLGEDHLAIKKLGGSADYGAR